MQAQMSQTAWLLSSQSHHKDPIQRLFLSGCSISQREQKTSHRRQLCQNMGNESRGHKFSVSCVWSAPQPGPGLSPLV